MRRSRAWASGIVAVALGMGTGSPARAIPIEDDEEITAGDIAFTVPDNVVQAKRREADRDGFSLLTGASLFGGVDGNVYRSPSALRQSTSAWGTWGLTRADTRFGNTRLLSSASWRIFQYPEFPIANSNRFHARQWIRHNVGERTWLEAALDLRRRNDDATTTDGLGYPEDYGYWRYRIEGTAGWSPSRGHRIEVGAMWALKNYDEVAALPTLDWNEVKVTARYRGRLSRGRYLVLTGATGTRDYDGDPATSLAGVESPANPPERHRYHDLSAGLDLPLGRRGDAEMEYSYAAKADQFEGYESYHVHRVALTGDVRLRGGWGLRGDAVWSHRDYDHLRGTGNVPLAYTLLEFGAGIRRQVAGPWWLFAHGSGFARDSNRETGDFYRDYSGIVVTAGVSWFR